MTGLKEMPSNEEAEKTIIGSILFDAACITKIIPWISDDRVFWYKENREIFKVLRTMHNEGKPIDLATVVNELKEKLGDAFPIKRFFDNYAKEVYLVHNVEYFAKSLFYKYLQRRFIDKTRQIENKAYDSPEIFETMLEEQDKIIKEIRELRPTDLQTTESIVVETLAHIKEKDNIIKFGIPQMDNAAGGITRREISVLGGRPSHGKTTVAMNMIISLLKQGYRVMVFNREMTNIEFMKKIFAHQSKLQYQKIRKNSLSLLEQDELNQVSDQVKLWTNLALFDNIRDLHGSIREIKRWKPDVVFDDHIGLIKPLREDQKRHEIAGIMEEYKWVAKYENCHIVMISQLNRELEKRIFDPKPKMSDYAESGVIEQLAELCMFVFRGYIIDAEAFDKYQIDFIVAKARYGDVATYPMGFDGNACKLYQSRDEAYFNRR